MRPLLQPLHQMISLPRQADHLHRRSATSILPLPLSCSSLVEGKERMHLIPRRPPSACSPMGLDRGVAVLISDSLALSARARNGPKRSLCAGYRILIWEEGMPTFVGFNTFAALPEEQISEKISRRILAGDQGMLVWWSIGAGVHVEPHSHANEQIAWMLKG